MRDPADQDLQALRCAGPTGAGPASSASGSCSSENSRLHASSAVAVCTKRLLQLRGCARARSGTAPSTSAGRQQRARECRAALVEGTAESARRATTRGDDQRRRAASAHAAGPAGPRRSRHSSEGRFGGRRRPSTRWRSLDGLCRDQALRRFRQFAGRAARMRCNTSASSPTPSTTASLPMSREVTRRPARSARRRRAGVRAPFPACRPCAPRPRRDRRCARTISSFGTSSLIATSSGWPMRASSASSASHCATLRG